MPRKKTLPTHVLATDLFYQIAEYLATADIVNLAECDSALLEVADYVLKRRRSVHLHLNSFRTVGALQKHLRYLAANTIRITVDFNAGNPNLSRILAECVAQCPLIRHLELVGYPPDEQVFETGGWLARLESIALESLSAGNCSALLSQCKAGNLHSVHVTDVCHFQLPHIPSVRYLRCSNLGAYTALSIAPSLSANIQLTSLSLEQMGEYLQYPPWTVCSQLQHLRIHCAGSADLQRPCGLQYLVRLQTLDIHLVESSLAEYFAGLAPHFAYPMRQLIVRLDYVDFANIAWHKLIGLPHLLRLALQVRSGVANEPALATGLATCAAQLRVLQISCSYNWNRMVGLGAEWVAASFPLLHTLRLELDVTGLRALAELPNLRDLHVLVNRRCQGLQAPHRWRRHAEIRRTLVALSHHPRLQRCTIGSKWCLSVRMDEWTWRSMGDWRQLRECMVFRVLRRSEVERLRATLPRWVRWAKRDDWPEEVFGAVVEAN